MYLDALEFLEDEHDGWVPYEALLVLTDEQLSMPVEAAHGWSGRDLIGHLLFWQGVSLDIARELALGETSATMARMDAEWETRGDAMNDELVVEWAKLPMDEVRHRFQTQPGELRGTLTVVPESRWVKHPTHMASFVTETVGHYRDHEPDLAAILAAVSA